MDDKFKKELEERFMAIGIRIADLANNSTDAGLVKKDLEKTNDNLFTLREAFDVFSDDCLTKDQALRNLINYWRGIFDAEILKISNFQNGLEQSIKELRDFQKYHYELDEKHKSLAKSSSNIHNVVMSVYDSLREAEKEILEIKSSSKVHEEKIEKLEKNFLSLKDFVKHLSDTQESHSRCIQNFQNHLDACLAYVRSHLTQLKEEEKKYFEVLKESIDKRFKELAIPDISHLADKKEIESFQHQINLSSLDAKNAYAKANYIEMQFQLLSKKLDGIMIQLK